MGDVAVRVEAHVVEVTAKTRWIFVEITTAEGLVGCGEGSLNTEDGAVLRAIEGLVPAVFAVGDVAPAVFPVPGCLAEAAAVSAVDQALWDLLGQRAGMSVAKALGGRQREAVRLYANINRRTRDRSPAGFAASARTAMAAGFRAFKIAPFDEIMPGAPRVAGLLEPGLMRLAAVREAIGGENDLMVDCHWRLDVAETETLIVEGEGLGLYWIECPIAEVPETLGTLRRLRGLANARGIRLAGNELGIGLRGFEPYLDAGAYDAMMPDAKYVGGLAHMMALAERFAAAGVAFSPHNPTGPICHAASLQVCGAAGVVDRLEVQFDETAWFGALVGGGVPSMVGGESAVPGGAGLGMRLSKEVLAQLRVARREWLRV